MARYLILFTFMLSILISAGCVNVQVDEPLVDLQDDYQGQYTTPSDSTGDPPTATDQQAKIQNLQKQLSRCRRKIQELKVDNENLENKIDRYEDQIDDMQEKIEDLQK